MMVRESDPSLERIGFEEDLRDEALIVCLPGLFLLIPLALWQFSLMDADAFSIGTGDPAPDWIVDSAHWVASFGGVQLEGRINEALAWIGFFGAELAKAVPLVDWSEVFDVANDSPIKPENALAKQIVFVVRASLDLLLIAAIVQAVSIAGRLSAQSAAFWTEENELKVLDPFAEQRALMQVWRGFDAHPHVPLWQQASATLFPQYEMGRLAQVAIAPDNLKAPAMRYATSRAAACVLAARASDKKTTDVLAHLVAGNDPTVQAVAMNLLVQRDAEASEGPLRSLLKNQEAEQSLRVAAARELGWLRRKNAADDLVASLAELKSLEAKTTVALALAKLGDKRAEDAMGDLAEELNKLKKQDSGPEAIIAAMRIAYGWALVVHGNLQPELRFGEEQQPFVKRAVASARASRTETGVWAPDKLARIPERRFMMGSPDGKGITTERPQHPRVIAAFEIGVYQVTFDEFDLFCDATGRTRPPDTRDWGRGQRPVINVSWHDAHAYVDWLNVWTGERFRLPSEAEWEYACRAVPDENHPHTDYSFGDDRAVLEDYAWFGTNSESKTQPVGVLKPNAFALYDMHGNVWEWCQDTWNESYDAPHRPVDGRAWLTGDARMRVLRGGSWNVNPEILRSADRLRLDPSNWSSGIGFRVARTLSPPTP